jgi:hypothetical protein
MLPTFIISLLVIWCLGAHCPPKERMRSKVGNSLSVEVPEKLPPRPPVFLFEMPPTMAPILCRYPGAVSASIIFPQQCISDLLVHQPSYPAGSREHFPPLTKSRRSIPQSTTLPAPQFPASPPSIPSSRPKAFNLL